MKEKKSSKKPPAWYFLFPGLWVFVMLSALGCGKVAVPPENAPPAGMGQLMPLLPASGSKSVFSAFRIQEAHQDYQRAYLDLISRINTLDGKGKEKEQAKIFENYLVVVRRYQNVVKKINEIEKVGRDQCFSIMRSLVMAVAVYDKKTGKKMFKLELPALVEEKILPELPKCPRDGEYSIFYKDGRRMLRCSIHGTLKQN